MQRPRPPIFVFDGPDAWVYDSVEAACGDLEIYDVRDGQLESFDSDGLPIEWQMSGYRVVDGSLTDGQTAMAEAVLERVRNHARVLGVGSRSPIDLETTDLPTLGHAILAYRPEPVTWRSLLTKRRQRA